MPTDFKEKVSQLLSKFESDAADGSLLRSLDAKISMNKAGKEVKSMAQKGERGLTAQIVSHIWAGRLHSILSMTSIGRVELQDAKELIINTRNTVRNVVRIMATSENIDADAEMKKTWEESKGIEGAELFSGWDPFEGTRD